MLRFPTTESVIHYDSTSAGKAAEGFYSAGPNIEAIARATTGIVHTLEAKSILVAFTHVHSHEGNPLYELADALAKAAAKGHDFAGPPSAVPTELYKSDHALADWMCLIDISSSVKAAYRLPPTDSNYVLCRMPNRPSTQQLTD